MIKPSHKTLTFLVIALIGTVVISIGIWWVNQNNQPPVVTINTNQPTNQPTASGTVTPPTKTDCTDELDTECWNTYTNKEYGFSIKYPSGWVYQEINIDHGKLIAFGTIESKVGGYIWGISVNYSDDIETVIAQNRRGTETKENVKVGGLIGVKVVSSIEMYPNWKSEIIYIKSGPKIFSISNGAVEDHKFESFLSSFRVI